MPPGYLATDGATATAAQHNDPLEDLEADMNTARPVVAGGTGATTASGARTNLGLVIGTNVQAYDAGLASIAGLTTAADRMIYTTGADTYAVATLTAAGRAILDDADAAAQRTTLGLVIGTDVQAYDADILKADVHDTLAAGFDSDVEALGTITGGTVTPEVDGASKPNFKTVYDGQRRPLCDDERSRFLFSHQENRFVLVADHRGAAMSLIPMVHTRLLPNFTFGDITVTVGENDGLFGWKDGGPLGSISSNTLLSVDGTPVSVPEISSNATNNIVSIGAFASTTEATQALARINADYTELRDSASVYVVPVSALSVSGSNIVANTASADRFTAGEVSSDYTLGWY